MAGRDVMSVVDALVGLVGEHYVDSDAAVSIAEVLRVGLAEQRYCSDERSLAETVTTDLQSVNGDPHLRLIYHAEPLPESEHGDDAAEYAAMAVWADRTCGGIARVEWLAGNVGYVDVQPILFPVAICGNTMAAAMTLLAPTSALIIDVRHCLGGDPAMVAFLCSYLYGPEPVELTRLYERGQERQLWTLPFVQGRRFGDTKPVYVLTSRATFSGGEQLSYDLQQLGRATIVGERTKGGANAREGFRLTEHLEATISVARAVSPRTGGNWEGTGVAPDVDVPAEQARERACQLALEHVVALDGPAALEAHNALLAMSL